NTAVYPPSSPDVTLTPIEYTLENGSSSRLSVADHRCCWKILTVLAPASKTMRVSGTPAATMAAAIAKQKRNNPMINNHGHRLISTAEMRANSSKTAAVMADQNRTDSGIWRVTMQIEPANRMVAIRSPPARFENLCRRVGIG